jgi:DNA (cytosine-5)-methyltransferase 1
MNYLDLFHGIGGFALGAYWAGMKFENHYCSDIETYAQELYKLRFPDSIQLGDITKINTAELPAGDWIISGGFPCQDISIAGKGAGIHGTRSGLWFEYWRIIRDLQPRFAIMENVSALTFRGLDAVLGSLAEIGYDAEWQDIRASDMGAPHKRERIWIIAYPESTRTGQNIGRLWSLSDGHSKGLQNSQDVAHPRLQRPPEHEEQTAGIEQCGEDVADTGREYGSERNAAGMETDQGQRTYSQLHAESGNKGHGRPDWTAEPAICGMADGIPDELHGYEGRLAVKSYQRIDRLRGLGNAIVPQIAELIFRQIGPIL